MVGGPGSSKHMPQMPGRQLGSFSKRNSCKPGEPLFTAQEVASKFGITTAKLHGLRAHNPGLESWSQLNSAAGCRTYFRLSDARRWWATIPEEKRQ